MAVLAECPTCHRRQTLRNKKCKCGADLDKAKKSNRIKYWLDYRLNNGRHRRESLTKYEDMDPYSLGDAKDALSKKRTQKRENKLFDTDSATKLAFNDLKSWYLSLEKTKGLRNYLTMKSLLEKFCREFGDQLVSTVRLSQLENLQVKRQRQGLVTGNSKTNVPPRSGLFSAQTRPHGLPQSPDRSWVAILFLTLLPIPG